MANKANKTNKEIEEIEECEQIQCHNPAQPLHSCPYQADVNENLKFKCNCCKDCEKGCCDDI